jgi:4-hydroxy-tetrahydrodipicolinate synthase
MKPLSSSEISGNWATLLLPVNSDDSIDYELLVYEIDVLISFGVDGIYSNGSAGEFYNQTEAEFDKISEIFACRCQRAGMPFQIGASHMSPIISLERVERAASLNPGAIQVILPDWFVPTIEEDIDFLSQAAEIANQIGLVLYNPPHAKRVLSAEQIGCIKSAVPQMVGIKVCDGDEAWYNQMRIHCKELSVFIPGHHLATGVKNGAHGAYSNVACIHPQVAQRWYNQTQTDINSALELEIRICRFMDEHIVPFLKSGYSNMAVDKLMAAMGGWCGISPKLRRPYCGVDIADVPALRSAAEKLIPEFLL